MKLHFAVKPNNYSGNEVCFLGRRLLAEGQMSQGGSPPNCPSNLARTKWGLWDSLRSKALLIIPTACFAKQSLSEVKEGGNLVIYKWIRGGKMLISLINEVKYFQTTDNNPKRRPFLKNYSKSEQYKIYWKEVFLACLNTKSDQEVEMGGKNVF